MFERMKIAGLTQTLVVAICVAVTTFAFLIAKEANQKRGQIAFENLTEDNKQAFMERMGRFLESLDAGAGLLAASEHVTLSEWRSFVNELGIERNLIGTNGIGLIFPVLNGEKQAFTEQARKDRGGDFNIRPEHSFPENFVIKYIEPITGNKEAVGLDIAFEEGRRGAALKARDEGIAVLTPRILLVQERSKRPGFLLLRPFYVPGMALNSVEQRRAAFVGWVYAPFVGARLFQNMPLSLSENRYIRVFDGNKIDPDALIYANGQGAEAPTDPQFRRLSTLALFGQEWTIEWLSTRTFDASQGLFTPYLVLLAGLFLTALIALQMRTLHRREAIVRRRVSQVTRELVASEERNRSVVENVMVAILVLDKDHLVLSANHTTRKLFGYDEAELLGRRINWLLPELSTKAKASSAPLNGASKGGAKLALDVQMNEWTTEGGDTRYSVLVRDVTEREKGAALLREAEDRWDRALTGAQIGVFDVNLVEGTSVVSDTWKRLMNMPVNDSKIDTQKEFMDRMHPDDVAGLRAADRACIEGETERSIAEYRIETHKGVWRWMRSDAVVAERAANGKALRLVGAQTDITPLREAEKALKSSEEQFRSLFQHAPVGMALVNGEGKFTGVNEALCNFILRSENELMTLDLREILPEGDFKVIMKSVQELQKGSVKTYQGEHRFLHPDGSHVWGLLSVSWTEDTGRQRDVYIAQIQDITEKKEIERIKSEFVATVSHELRTPLTSIKGSLGLVLGTLAENVPKSGQRLLRIAEENCDRLVRLVNDILDLEKVSSDQISFSPTRLDIKSVIQTALVHIKPFADQHGVKIRAEMPKDHPQVFADPRRLEQVLFNLLSNAAKFSESGGEVLVKVGRDEESLSISVTDNGIGISEGFKSKVFEPFTQADSSATRKKGGTGLGLNISKQIVEKLGGQIGFDSKAGGPTTFWFTLPEFREPTGDMTNGPRIKRSTGTRARILHVEDDSDFAEVLTTSLGVGLDVIKAATLREAQELIKEQAFDLFIIDWELPDGDGAMLLENISRLHQGTPVIGLSAHDARIHDHRVLYNITKSKTGMPEIVASVAELAGDRLKARA